MKGPTALKVAGAPGPFKEAERNVRNSRAEVSAAFSVCF